MSDATIKDLIVVVADRDMESVLKGILSRSEALRIRPICHDIRVLQHDSNVRKNAESFLRPFATKYSHALVLFDFKGSGGATQSREKIESDLEKRLSLSGWEDHARVVVIDPELEQWIWSQSPHVATALGWDVSYSQLASWLVAQGLLKTGGVKPADPKEAMKEALKKARKRQKASIYGNIANKVSLDHCTDPAFDKLRTTLREWFPVEETRS